MENVKCIPILLEMSLQPGTSVMENISKDFCSENILKIPRIDEVTLMVGNI